MKRLAAIICSFMVVVGMINIVHMYQYSSPTPDQAASNYLARVTSNSPHEIESINIVSATSGDEKGGVLTILFRAREQDPNVHTVGYAILKHSIFGWRVESLQMAGQSPLPEDALVRVERLEDKQVVFGQVFLVDAARVEAVFSDTTIATEVPSGNFVLFGSQYGEFLEFKILDSEGNLLKQFTKDELQNR